jgi:cytochrome c-type biogenesis protein CcmE
MNTLRRTVLIASSLSLAALIAACGGGTGGTGVTSNNPTNAVSIGVMAKGSVIVNGVHFEDNAAKIAIDDTPKTPADLQSGMVVRVRGQINDDRTTGTAQIVNVSTEVRGTVLTHDATVVPPRFTVVGQTVFVDDLTVLANFGTPAPTPANAVAALDDGTSVVEVHGLRDATGVIHASRVELLNANPLGDELRGTVAALGATTFTLQNGTTNVTVNFSGATIVPATATLANGEIVEVHGAFNGATFTATSINIEDDAQFEHQAGEEFEIEGLVSGCGTANSCTLFNVGAQAVQVNASTRFEGGLPTDLADGIRVEAEGHQFSGSTLIAEKIEFKRSVIRLQGATANATANSFELHIANDTFVVTIQVDSLTSGAVPANGLACVQVRGQRKSPATPLVVIAGEIDTGCSNSNRHLIQAPVEAESGTTLTLLGFPIDAGNPTDVPPYEDVNEQPLTQAQFFNAVTPANTDANGVSHAGTLVKLTFNDGASTVHQAEIEQD